MPLHSWNGVTGYPEPRTASLEERWPRTGESWGHDCHDVVSTLLYRPMQVTGSTHIQGGWKHNSPFAAATALAHGRGLGFRKLGQLPPLPRLVKFRVWHRECRWELASDLELHKLQMNKSICTIAEEAKTTSQLKAAKRFLPLPSFLPCMQLW